MEGIDFVITWVDGSDDAWRREKAVYSPEGENDDSEERYRDWGLLKYWFRGVERFAPWVRKIHFVTWGHLPVWLNVNHSKLHIVRHEDYIPKQFLPIFNSTVLEIYLHKIEDLSDNFVYFNDDMFLIGVMSPDMFFRNGKPCDMLAFQPIVANPSNPVMSHQFLNNTLILSKYFEKRENVRRHAKDYFKVGYPLLYFFYNILELAFPLYTGFYTVHGPAPLCKGTFEEVWEREEKFLTAMSLNRFRGDNDVNQYLFREWQKLTGNFHAENILRNFQYFNISEDNSALIHTIKKQKKKIICINDNHINRDFESVKAEIQGAFDEILPEMSSFEQ